MFRGPALLPGVGLVTVLRSIRARLPATRRFKGPFSAGTRRPAQRTPRLKTAALGAPKAAAATVNVPVFRTNSEKGNRPRCRRGDLRLVLLPTAPPSRPPETPLSPPRPPPSRVPRGGVLASAMIIRRPNHTTGVVVVLRMRRRRGNIKWLREPQACTTF